MSKENIRSPAELLGKVYYHGTRRVLKVGDQIEPTDLPPSDEAEGMKSKYVFLTANLDEAIWEAEISGGEGPGRVYIVEPIGSLESASELPSRKALRHPAMSAFSRQPLRVRGEVTEWTLYHGTRAKLKVGDFIKAGCISNFGKTERIANYVYMARTLEAAIWGAELAKGEGPARIYTVEPTGPVEDDPNLTNQKFRGNPSQSFRSRAPLRVTGEIMEWKGHAPEVVQAMKDGIARLEERGIEADD